MNVPASTYRVQLNRDFKFRDLLRIVDYLAALGITTIYAAPITTATPRSMHGYDAIDSHSINPEIGTLEEFGQLHSKISSLGITWLQDIVPNHMAFHPFNFRLMDVLERGPMSSYYHYFDIDWDHHSSDLKGKVMVPFLGRPLSECVTQKEITLDFNSNGVTVNYFDSSYPLSIMGYQHIWNHDQEFNWLERLIAVGFTEMSCEDWQLEKSKRFEAVLNDDNSHQILLDRIQEINANNDLLIVILQDQFYRLAYWKETEVKINYRRFFTVNELICLRMEDDAVFNEYHSLFLKLFNEEKIQGLRIDHIDGLKEPARYVRNLRLIFGSECFIIAEKILESKESIPKDWPLEGTSGYEFLSYLNQLMTNRKGGKLLRDFYQTLVPNALKYAEIVSANKKLILEKYMVGEWENLTNLFFKLHLNDDFQFDKMKQAIGALMIALPVYRIYPENLPVTGTDLIVLNEAFQKAIASNADLKIELEWLKGEFVTAKKSQLILIGESETPVDELSSNQEFLEFLKRLMQFTGPLTAKGVEDTTFYNYNALLSHDEVGDSPSTLGISINQFHSQMKQRQKFTSLSLNTTSTHDTKRGEDGRIRLNALCDLPEEWIALVKQWQESNRKFHQRTTKGLLAPVINDEYFIYQSLVSGFPEDLNITSHYLARLSDYLIKVLREAKTRSDWATPDSEYEEACLSFVRNITRSETLFMQSFIPFMRRVIRIANRYCLGQTLIKLTAPGIPDIYQGCELWDLSYVDPDNRRPVDYAARENYLLQLVELEKQGLQVLFTYLDDHLETGIGKLFITWKVLNFRRAYAQHFSQGEYCPLQIAGKESITIAYARIFQSDWIIVVVPFKTKESEISYMDDEIVLPDSAPSDWKNIFDNEMIQSNGRIPLSACISRFPLAMLSSVL